MKKHLLKTLFLCLFTLAGTTASAYDCYVDSIYYNLDTTNQTASVTGRTSISGGYSGAVTIPNEMEYNGVTYSVTSIGNNAFRNSRDLTALTIPNSVTSIGSSAFSGCSGLTELTISSSVTSIGSSAFSGCSGLEKIVVEAGNPYYDSRENCNAIISTDMNSLIAGCKNTHIPNSVTSIGDRTFYNCTGLTEVTIPYNVTTIGDYAFYNCTGLTEVTIPYNVTAIGDHAFQSCSSLTEVTIADGKDVLSFSTTYASTPFSDCPIGTLYLGRTINYNADSPFSNNESLKTLTIGNSVTFIGKSAFKNCSGLTVVTIPNSVTSIGSSAFSDCI